MVARFIGVKEVVEQYLKKDMPNFSIWCKTALICQYNGDSMEEGEAMIREEIERNIKRQMPYECVLRIHPDQAKNYDLKSPVAYNISFKSYEDGFDGSMGGNALNYRLLQSISAIESRMAAWEEQQEDEDEDEEEEQQHNAPLNGMLGQIDKLMEHPIINKLIEKFLMPNDQPTQQQPRASIAGNPESEAEQTKKLQQAITVLFSKGVTIDHFVKLAAMPPDKIKMLLTLL